jgi:hypothetical protein
MDDTVFFSAADANQMQFMSTREVASPQSSPAGRWGSGVMTPAPKRQVVRLRMNNLVAKQPGSRVFTRLGPEHAPRYSDAGTKRAIESATVMYFSKALDKSAHQTGLPISLHKAAGRAISADVYPTRGVFGVTIKATVDEASIPECSDLDGVLTVTSKLPPYTQGVTPLDR